MQVKRFEAASAKDVLRRIKSNMGEEAIVLSTKHLPNGRVEILAAKENDFLKNAVTSSDLLIDGDGGNILGKGNQDDLSFIKKEIIEIKSMIQSAQRNETVSVLKEIMNGMDVLFDSLAMQDGECGNGTPLPQMHRYLLERGMSQKGTLGVLIEFYKGYHKQTDFEEGLNLMEPIVKSRFLKNGEDSARVEVFIGPAGVGKTTTLAKLAARYALEQKKSVGLITTDIYRIAAADQLRTYAHIMGLPIEVACEKGDFRKAMDRLHDRDCILIDTPGGGGRGEGDYLSRIKDMMGRQTDMEVNLLLSLATGKENMLDMAHRFSAFGYDKVIFTKLDECSRFGILYDIAESIQRPVSYLATGQDVPRDIEKATPERLAGLILGV
jgi:flagellar biosynthesis protein FlhF